MSDDQTKLKSPAPGIARPISWEPASSGPAPRKTRAPWRSLVTLCFVALAAYCGWKTWNADIDTPSTRDGTVRAYVVTMAPEVAGRIVALPVADNQYVHKGDLLVTIEPTDYSIAVQQAQASVDQARASAGNATREAQRREALSDLSVSQEQRQTFQANAAALEAAYRKAQADLEQARENLARTSIRSPVNGYVTNLMAQVGDYATVGKNVVSVVNADSFWVDGYFEESYLRRIHVGDTATVRLMGWPEPVLGHVESIARGITVANAEQGQSGLATVNPVYTWVQLAQRVPVRVRIDQVPEDMSLVVGQTANVSIETKKASAAAS